MHIATSTLLYVLVILLYFNTFIYTKYAFNAISHSCKFMFHLTTLSYREFLVHLYNIVPYNYTLIPSYNTISLSINAINIIMHI